MTPRDHDGDETQKPAPVIITDKRHSRALDEAEEPAPAPDVTASMPAPPPAAPVGPEPEPAPEGVVEFTRPAQAAPAPPAEEAGAPVEAEEGPGGYDEEAYAAAEMEHLKMLFGAGLVNYLRSQLGLLLNFALIHLGRAPNPATGLVSTELDKAKLAIDLLEFMGSRLKGQLPQQEEQEITQILAELKYTFLQLAASGPKPPAGGQA